MAASLRLPSSHHLTVRRSGLAYALIAQHAACCAPAWSAQSDKAGPAWKLNKRRLHAGTLTDSWDIAQWADSHSSNAAPSLFPADKLEEIRK